MTGALEPGQTCAAGVEAPKTERCEVCANPTSCTWIAGLDACATWVSVFEGTMGTSGWFGTAD